MLAGLAREVRILGVNQIGAEGGNATTTAGRTVPWLQDTVEADAWALWGPAYRDVVILDEANLPVAVYNLTVHDLQDPANYAELRDLLVGLASAP